MAPAAVASLLVVDHAAAVAAAAADRVTALLADAIRTRGSASLALSGGDTPAGLYRCLSDPAGPWRTRVDWRRVVFAWGDERLVPPTHPRSNARMARETLLEPLAIAPEQIHSIDGTSPTAEQAARAYDRTLRQLFAADPLVSFDLILLGLGADTHIASLFPGSPPPDHPDALAAAVASSDTRESRVTITARTIEMARAILVLVSGPDKAAALATALDAPADPGRCPAHLLRGAGSRVTWIVDRAAAPQRAPVR